MGGGPRVVHAEAAALLSAVRLGPELAADRGEVGTELHRSTPHWDRRQSTTLLAHVLLHPGFAHVFISGGLPRQVALLYHQLPRDRCGRCCRAFAELGRRRRGLRQFPTLTPTPRSRSLEPSCVTFPSLPTAK